MKQDDRGTTTIEYTADDGRLYLFATAHFLDGIREATPRREPGGATERLRLRYTTGEVVLLGSGFEQILDNLARGRLSGLRSMDPGRTEWIHLRPHVVSIVVKQKNDE